VLVDPRVETDPAVGGRPRGAILLQPVRRPRRCA
jgi:hypothetical protein